MPPHNFPVEQGHSVSPPKVLGDVFINKPLHGRCGNKLFGQIYEACFTYEIND